MKIVITGPESTGKTTIVEVLSSHFNVNPVWEYARTYLEKISPIYDESDLLEIAKIQFKEIKNAAKKEKITIIDTDLLTIKIWSEYKYGRCDNWIINKLQLSKPDLYLLCSPDIPWVFDPMREHPHERQELFEIYLQNIKELEVPYIILIGDVPNRKKSAIMAIEKLKSQS